MRAAVLGAGLSGAAAAALLRREGCAVDVLDGAVPFPGDVQYDFAVASPGIALDHPWQMECRARGIKTVSELQLGWERWKALGGRTLAVTGSKGKSSVVKLVADALGGVPCGNYGRPLCDLVSETVSSSRRVEDNALCHRPSSPFAVVEVSSFQMETTDGFRPEAAVILNLQEDHLDRHGTKDVYHALKRKLLDGAERSLDCSSMDESGIAEDVRALFAGSYFDNAVLSVNAAAAVWLMRTAGLEDSAIAAAFASFTPLPHRMQTVCERGGVRFIDDSKATSLAALEAGVRMAGRPVRLIAGGLGKGDDEFSLIPCLQSTTKKVYLIGRCADRLYDAWHLALPCELCGTLEAAVSAALRDARPGEAVLLSPGAASFDQFESFGARGDRFAALVTKESEKYEC